MEKNLCEELLQEVKRERELIGDIAEGRKMGKKRLLIDTPTAIFLVAGLYLMFTGQQKDTQVLGAILTGLGFLLMWGKM